MLQVFKVKKKSTLNLGSKLHPQCYLFDLAIPDIGHLESLAEPFFLDVVGKREEVLVIVLMEQSQTVAQDNFPARI